MDWNLTNNKGELLPPRNFGEKSQLDIINEIITAFETHRIVLLEGACGTGKSAIALHLIKNFGNGIITVPLINLQKQYKRDYTNMMKVHDVNVGFVMGRSNFDCPMGFEADKRPCTKKLHKNQSRIKVASLCPNWSPRYPDFVDTKNLKPDDYTILTYQSHTGAINLFLSDNPCPYYKQFTSYLDSGTDTDLVSNAIILNDMMWTIETGMGRKPMVDIEIFDEYDCFFDKLSDDIIISDRFFKRLQPRNRPNKMDEDLTELYERKKEVFKKFMLLFGSKETFTKGLVHEFLCNDYLKLLEMYVDKGQEVSDYSIKTKLDMLNHYLEHWDSVFWDSDDKCRIIKELRLGLAYPDKILEKLFDESVTAPRILLMSGTQHSPMVMRELYGIEPYVVKSGAKIGGKVQLCKTNYISVTNKTWHNETVQNNYYNVMHDIITKASEKNEKILIQTPAKKYIKPIIEDKRYEDRILYDGYTDNGDNSVELQNWIEGRDKNILVSTRVARGVDLKDDLCRHIIIAKCPFPFYMSPNMQSLRTRFGTSGIFNAIYKDITIRTLLQQLSRASRHSNDWVKIWTPDLMAMQNILSLRNKFENFEYI